MAGRARAAAAAAAGGGFGRGTRPGPVGTPPAADANREDGRVSPGAAAATPQAEAPRGLSLHRRGPAPRRGPPLPARPAGGGGGAHPPGHCTLPILTARRRGQTPASPERVPVSGSLHFSEFPCSRLRKGTGLPLHQVRAGREHDGHPKHQACGVVSPPDQRGRRVF